MLSNPRQNDPRRFKIPTWLLGVFAGASLLLVLWLGSPWAAHFFVSRVLGQDAETGFAEESSPAPDAPEFTTPPTETPPLPTPEVPPLLKPLIEALSQANAPPEPKVVPPQPLPTGERTEFWLDYVLPQMDGSLQHQRVPRKGSLGPDPKAGVLQALLDGPTAEELSQNLLSLIPPETRLRSVSQTGDLLTVNFSEEFQYNSLGSEGYRAQVIQVLQTLSQFPDVKRVQFLIEGQRLSSLGDAIPIGQPLDVHRFQ